MADASPGPSVGGITFKISVDLSAVDMKGLLDLNCSEVNSARHPRSSLYVIFLSLLLSFLTHT